MLINGNIGTDKTELLVDKYLELLNNNVNPQEILILVLNAYKKADFLKKITGIAPDLRTSKHNIYTFSGLCYNAFLDNWEFISKYTHNDSETQKPNLCGLEVSQYIFKESIKTADFSDYISKINLLHQLFRRYSLIVQNCLSNDEVKKRSKILGESFAQEAQKAIDEYKLKTFEYKSFDYLRQFAVFPLIYNNTDYFKDIKYLLVDDADEYSYAFWLFVDKIMPSLTDYMISYDEKGTTRCGYLCAYKNGIKDFTKKYSPEIKTLIAQSKFSKIQNTLYENIKAGKKTKLTEFKYKTAVKRLEMLQEAAIYIKNLLKSGIKEEDIAIITPLEDDVLFEALENAKINYQVLSGSEKLADDFTIKNIIVTLKLINGLKVSEYELKNILIKLLKIPYRKCLNLLHLFNAEKKLTGFDFNNEEQNYKYSKLLSLLNAQKKSNNSMSKQISAVFENLIKEFNPDYSKEKYNFLLKEAQGFEAAFENKSEKLVLEFITQIENSIISENPADTIEIKRGKVIISTMQKVIDYSFKTKHQLWLDISSSEWIKNDTGTLYNAWVLSRDWNKENFTFEDNIKLTNDKTARMVRKLIFCAQNEIVLFSSLYDNSGNENFSGLTDFIEVEQEKKPEFKIIPRKDQARVLEYNSGKLGVMAVPGAGKTTILLALIIKLMKEGVKAQNIFVLTYMESAAKNFKERIKQAFSDSSELPNISTIHGLALRIIKENGNFTSIGLDENFEICDDNTKESILKGLFFRLKIDEDKYENYVKCISDVKLSCRKGYLSSKFKEIQDFYNFYNCYNQYLKQNNLIDYDDMLYYSVKILEENPQIRTYYQNLCQYIIEDEAQDSTDIQQKLIGILSAKHKNLVRCGDINQAITSTFTNSNPEGFKNFIKENKKIEMNSSQRCAKQIYTIANDFIKESKKTIDAFYDIEMQGTDKNPVTDKKPQYLLFDTEKEEKNFILNKIKEIKSQTPNATIAILLRLNSQVNDYNEYFLSNEIKTTVRTDTPSQKSIYKIIYTLLKIVQNPINNNNIYEFALLYKQKGIYDFKQSDFDFIKNLKTPFINLNPDEIDSEGLLQLYFDIDYQLNNSTVSTDIFSLKAGLYYAKTSADKSNAYMVSTLIKRLMQNCNNEEELLAKLEYASQKNSGTYKFFDDNENTENAINIMTMHKSKGDEFDIVFIPELNEENYSTKIETVKLKSGSHFVQTIKNSVDGSNPKTPEELKQEQINETMRLLYVGITRAKQELYFSNAANYRKRKNTKPVEIVKICINNIS